MYKLTLTADERKAIDWVGNRYYHGDDLYSLLWGCDISPSDSEWDSPNDITFTIPEHKAWEVQEIGRECNYLWDCFAPELCQKLNTFCESIV